MKEITEISNINSSNYDLNTHISTYVQLTDIHRFITPHGVAKTKHRYEEQVETTRTDQIQELHSSNNNHTSIDQTITNTQN